MNHPLAPPPGEDERPLPVRFGSDGLIPAVIQDATSRVVLMVGFMNGDALRQTRATGRVHFWSRSRGKLWRKGEESGHTQRVREIRLDCDNDVVLLKIEQAGGIACHTGRPSCFYQKLVDGEWVVMDQPLKDPATMYRTK